MELPLLQREAVIAKGPIVLACSQSPDEEKHLGDRHLLSHEDIPESGSPELLDVAREGVCCSLEIPMSR